MKCASYLVQLLDLYELLSNNHTCTRDLLAIGVHFDGFFVQ
jgi:hypothetical protein